MKVNTEFMSGKHTLVFDDGREVVLTASESAEFELWFQDKKRESEAE